MKDLFVLAADADAQALLQSLLSRHRALGIRPISYHVHRFPGRDSGMVQTGPEIARVLVDKSQYSRLLLIWDYHGSGWESKGVAHFAARIQERLNWVTWHQRASAVVLVPELEEWFWHCNRSIAMHLAMSETELGTSAGHAATRLGKPVEHSMQELPKELFEIVLHSRLRRQPLPEDFSILGASAKIGDLRRSKSFDSFNRILQSWFAPNDQKRGCA